MKEAKRYTLQELIQIDAEMAERKAEMVMLREIARSIDPTLIALKEAAERFRAQRP